MKMVLAMWGSVFVSLFIIWLCFITVLSMAWVTKLLWTAVFL